MTAVPEVNLCSHCVWRIPNTTDTTATCDRFRDRPRVRLARQMCQGLLFVKAKDVTIAEIAKLMHDAAGARERAASARERARSPKLDTMTLRELLRELAIFTHVDLLDLPVRLIVGGVAHPVIMVWRERYQEGGASAAICIGDDPR